MYKGVSCADRYLRWLQNENKVESCKKPDDKTFTWYVCKPELAEITYPCVEKSTRKDTRSIPEIQRDEAIGKTRFEAESAKRIKYKVGNQLSLL